MNVGVKFEQRPMGLGTVIESLVLLAAYLGLVLAIIVVIKGPTVLEHVPGGHGIAAWTTGTTAATQAEH